MPTKLPVSEAAFTDAVIHLAQLKGWRVFHQLPARKADGSWRSATQGDIGFPDLILCRESLLVVELKSETGRISDGQALWIAAFTAAGIEVHVWRPSDWDQVVEALDDSKERAAESRV